MTTSGGPWQEAARQAAEKAAPAEQKGYEPLALAVRGEYDGAIRKLREAIVENPSYLPAQKNLLAACVESGRWAEALVAGKVVEELHPLRELIGKDEPPEDEAQRLRLFGPGKETVGRLLEVRKAAPELAGRIEWVLATFGKTKESGAAGAGPAGAAGPGGMPGMAGGQAMPRSPVELPQVP